MGEGLRVAKLSVELNNSEKREAKLREENEAWGKTVAQYCSVLGLKNIAYDKLLSDAQELAEQVDTALFKIADKHCKEAQDFLLKYPRRTGGGG